MEALLSSLSSINEDLARLALRYTATWLTVVAMFVIVVISFFFGLVMWRDQAKVLDRIDQRTEVTQANAAKIAAALENVSRLVVHAGRAGIGPGSSPRE